MARAPKVHPTNPLVQSAPTGESAGSDWDLRSLDSYALIAAAPRRAAERVLDVCCGSGVQGMVALSYAREVTFVDASRLGKREGERGILGVDSLSHSFQPSFFSKTGGFPLAGVDGFLEGWIPGKNGEVISRGMG